MTETKENSGAVKTADLVAYQTDSIVSRIVVKSTGGSVTAFAFDAGQDLSEHTVPFSATLHVVDGEAEVRIADRDYRVGTGEVIVLPANVPHAVRAVHRFKMLLSMVKD